MPIYTPQAEGQHEGEFLVSEANGTLSRESGIVSSGQNLVDGQLVQLSGTELVAKDNVVDTDGNFVTPVEGIVLGNRNASSTGPFGAADMPTAYIKRLAEVKEELLTFPSGAKDEAVAALAAMNIVVR